MAGERIIAIETSSRQGSVALGVGDDLVDTATLSADMRHARELLPALDELFHRHGWTPDRIDHCYLSVGPGSFTGLRVGVTFARHLALATGARLCAIPTLDVIAANAADLPDRPSNLAVVLDAKRGQVFAATYSATTSGYRRVRDADLCDPAALFAVVPRPLAVMGEGVDYHRGVIEAASVMVLSPSTWVPQASKVFALGRIQAQCSAFTEPRELIPEYIRRPEAEELWEKRHR